MRRSLSVLIIVLLLFAVLPLRLIYLVQNTQSFPKVSNSSRNITISELRGEIYDCNMQPLVNRKSQNVVVAMPYLQSAEVLKNYLENEEYLSLVQSIEISEPFICDCGLVDENDFLKCTQKFSRYTDDGFCCHVVGYVNSADNQGVYGIEKSFDSLLKEEKRKLVFRYNTTAHNRLLTGGDSRFVSENYYSKKGIRLTVDSEIQRISENALHLYGVEKGAAVVLDAETGEIKAMASAPVFNQNDIAESLEDENSPFLNRAVNAYSVGSVFKLVVALTAIKEGKEDFTSYCNGSLEISETRFACSDSSSHGQMNLRKAFAYSCNTYFIRLALELGSEKILRTAENLGFGKSFLLADGFYSSAGKLPDLSEVMTDGMLANLSFGQGGLLATPLQVASCYSAVANGGEYISPKLVISAVDSDGSEEKIKGSQYRYRALSRGEAEIMKELLINNFKEGTCVSAKPDKCVAGGKTSTAETGMKDEKGREILHSWFAGFAECGDDVYTIVVFKEDGVSGGKDCGPVFHEIADRISEVKSK